MDSWPNSFDTSSSGTPLLRRSTAKVSRNLWLSNVSGCLDSGLLYARQVTNLNIWKRKLDSLPSLVPAERFLSSTTIESRQFSPDGSRIVFESTRSGAYEVWECRSDGSNLVQLTHLNSVTGTPRWSPDGQQIAFDSRAPGNADIFVMDSRGGSLRNLTNEASTDPRAQLVARRALDLFRIRSQRRVASMEC